MAAFSVTTTTSSYPLPSLHQPRPSPISSSSSSSTHFQGSLLLQNWNFGGFPSWRTERTTLICAVNQDAKQAVKDTVQLDLLKEDSKQVHDNGMEVWSQFAKRVSGEWDGFGADFSNEGKPVELPETVVPEAYREWEVRVFDWQTQCPTLAEPGDRVLEYKSIQLLPTVGCEADAATRYSIDERKVGGADTGITAFAYQSSGSYVALWDKKDGLLELEYCLISPQDCESRVRIIQHINVSDNTKMVLQSIRVFCEQWYGPFRNGDQLGGCAIRDSAFAATAPLTASEVTGVWQGSKAIATFDDSNTGSFRPLLDDQVLNSVRDGDNNMLLPKKLWCSLRESNDGGTLSEVGWISDHGRAITSSCIFSSTAKLKFAERVSGEWNGYGAEFSNQGKPIELPSFLCLKHTKIGRFNYSIGRLNAPPLLTEYKSIHLNPTTGCDAATRYSTVEIRVGGTNTGLAAFAYESSGCYVAVWQKKDKLLELEYC